MPEHDERSIGPPGSATVVGIVIVSIFIMIASGYMIYNYSSPRPAAQVTHTTAPTAK